MKTKEICLRGLMIALVTVSTMVLQIPVSATNGYIHLGDSMILLISVFFGCTVWWLAVWEPHWLTCSADMPIGRLLH